jgi:hypothetical protein
MTYTVACLVCFWSQYTDAAHLLFEQHGITLLGLRLNLDELEENQRCGSRGGGGGPGASNCSVSRRGWLAAPMVAAEKSCRCSPEVLVPAS